MDVGQRGRTRFYLKWERALRLVVNPWTCDGRDLFTIDLIYVFFVHSLIISGRNCSQYLGLQIEPDNLIFELDIEVLCGHAQFL